MAEQIQDLVNLVECLVRPLVDFEDDLVISTEEDGDKVTIGISVNEEDAGKIIGRQGRVIKSIRTLARAAATRKDIAVDVEIIE